MDNVYGCVRQTRIYEWDAAAVTVATGDHRHCRCDRATRRTVGCYLPVGYRDRPPNEKILVSSVRPPLSKLFHTTQIITQYTEINKLKIGHTKHGYLTIKKVSPTSGIQLTIKHRM